LKFIADRGDARRRLDQILVRRITGVTRMSRNLAQRWIESGLVTVDLASARRPSARVREGASIEVAIPDSAPRRTRPEAEPGSLEVLYEDDALIAINKPAGIVVHPSYKQLTGTLLNTLLWRVRDRGNVQPGILTRLDKDTSGIVIVALTPDVHAAMQRDAAAGMIRKEYLAIVNGAPRPRSGRIREPLARDPDDRRRVTVMTGGAYSETRYEVLARDRELSLVRCELVTGRTHQIRVHLAHKGWPILGDRLYGEADERIARQALHAWRIAFPHPSTRGLIEIEAPLPVDMRRLEVCQNGGGVLARSQRRMSVSR
jgi:23S rRNA pseudouridine1911/1915/1917 synthase